LFHNFVEIRAHGRQLKPDDIVCLLVLTIAGVDKSVLQKYVFRKGKIAFIVCEHGSESREVWFQWRDIQLKLNQRNHSCRLCSSFSCLAMQPYFTANL